MSYLKNYGTTWFPNNGRNPNLDPELGMYNIVGKYMKWIECKDLNPDFGIEHGQRSTEKSYGQALQFARAYVDDVPED